MRLAHSYADVTFFAVAVLSFAFVADSAWAAGEIVVSHNGVTIRVLDVPFSGDGASLKVTHSDPGSLDRLPVRVSGSVVLETESAVVASTAASGVLAFWTRQGDQLTRQGEVLLSSVSDSSPLHIVADESQGIAVTMGDRQEGLQQFIALSKDGILEIRQPAERTISVRSALRYVLVPSLVGTDLLFDPVGLPPGKPRYLPSLNLVVGLQEGEHGMLNVVWPPGEQLACVRTTEKGGTRSIESFELDTAGQPAFISFIDHPQIWHVERLREEYLETDTPIQWKKPFSARWIGRFFIDSDRYDFPFYFLGERRKLWGRYIRGWFYYPVWFDGDKTMVHFEKKFPPVGELLIYYLDTYGDGEQLSPVGVMQSTLGKDVAASLLDFEGTREQVLLEHRNAVCAMTYKIEAYFGQEPQSPPWSEVQQYTNDVATFIRLIRERVFQFDRFATELQELCQIEQENNPTLAEGLKPCEEILAEIRDIVAADMPETSLEEVGQWTNNIQKLTRDDKHNSLLTAKALTQKCRSVAGTQDDMARNLSVVTIRLMEEAARMGTASPQHVRLAEQIIGRCRKILREPTWWEPCRQYLPKSDPGAPSPGSP